MDAPSAPAKQDKAALLSAFYGHLGSRITSLGRRSSFLIAFLASFLGFTAAPLVRNADASAAEKLGFVLRHPSLTTGLAGVVVLLWSQLARMRRADDLFTQIASSDAQPAPFQDQFVASPIDPLFGEMIANTRIEGEFLRRKARMFDAGAFLFVLSVTLYALGF